MFKIISSHVIYYIIPIIISSSSSIFGCTRQIQCITCKERAILFNWCYSSQKKC